MRFKAARLLAALAWRFGLRSYRPSQRAGQQAFLGLMAGAVFLDRPLRPLSPRRTDLRQALCASYAKTRPIRSHSRSCIPMGGAWLILPEQH